jgi:hypothetical protein
MVVLRISVVVFLAVIAVFVSPTYAQNQTHMQTQEWSTYDDRILGVSIQHPSGWEVEEEPNVVWLYNGSDGEVLVSADPSTFENSEEFMKDTINDLRGETDKINQIDNDVQMAGKPASKVDFTYKPDPTDSSEYLHQIMYFMVDEESNTMYMIGFGISEENYTKYQPIIQRMVNSFKIQRIVAGVLCYRPS